MRMSTAGMQTRMSTSGGVGRTPYCTTHKSKTRTYTNTHAHTHSHIRIQNSHTHTSTTPSSHTHTHTHTHTHKHTQTHLHNALIDAGHGVKLAIGVVVDEHHSLGPSQLCMVHFEPVRNRRGGCSRPTNYRHDVTSNLFGVPEGDVGEGGARPHKAAFHVGCVREYSCQFCESRSAAVAAVACCLACQT